MSVFSPCSPVMIAVTPFSLSQRNSRRSSARRIASLGRPANSASTRVQHHALGADLVDHRVEADEQPFQVVLAGLLDLAALDVDVIDRHLLPAIRPLTSKPSDATFLASSSAVSSKDMKTPGSLNSVMPRTMNSIASSVLPRSGAAADQRGPPRAGRPR